MLDTTEFNRIKIKDMIAAIKRDIAPDNVLGLQRLKNFAEIEKNSLKEAGDDDVKRVEQYLLNVN